MTERGQRAADAPRQPAKGLRLSQQVFILYAGIVVLVITSGVVVGIVIADRLAQRGAEERVLSVAQAVATMPDVAEAMQQPDPSLTLQPLAERVRHNADVSFVVMASPEGIRYSHPNPARIGGHFIGTYEPAAAGGIVVETFEGTLGPSVRAVVPVLADEAEGEAPLGIVAVGVTVDRVSDELAKVLPLLFGAAALALVVAAGASWWVARRLSRQTFGMDAGELARVYAHHDAVLHGVREGLVVVDANRRVVLINDAARQLLGVEFEAQGRPAADLPVTGPLAELLASGETVEDVVHLAGEQLVVVSQVPVGAQSTAPGAASLGTVLTMRDHTQVMALVDELSATRSIADALRAHVHESSNRLHTIVMLVKLGDADAAVRLATGDVRATQALTNRLVGQFEEPTLVALLLGKASEATQRSVDLVITDDSRLFAEYPEPVDLITIVGNLIDNAIEAALTGSAPRRVEVAIGTTEAGDELVVRVRDSGPGFSPEALANVFQPGWSTKPADPERSQGRGIGMALVQQVVVRRGGRVEVANAVDEDASGLGGAVVVVRLPLAGAEAASEPEAPEPLPTAD